MEVTKCLGNDFVSLRTFYRYVIDNTPEMKTHCPWVYGKHPTDQSPTGQSPPGFGGEPNPD